jgi:hypothetical protein
MFSLVCFAFGGAGGADSRHLSGRAAMGRLCGSPDFGIKPKHGQVRASVSASFIQMDHVVTSANVILNLKL